MDALNRTKLAPLVEAVLATAGGHITQGLSDAYAQWALTAYRQTVLPYRLRQAQDSSPGEQAATVSLVAAEVREVLGPLTPDQRMHAIVQTYYRTVLAPFSDTAFSLAQQVAEQPGEQGNLQGEAERTLRAVNTFIAQVRKEAPLVLDDLRGELSETILDCRHVLGQTPLLSRRLNRYLDHLAARRQRCPQCGGAASPGAKFCPDCGARLRQEP